MNFALCFVALLSLTSPLLSNALRSAGLQKVISAYPHPKIDPRTRYGATFPREKYSASSGDSTGIGGDIWPTSIFWNYYEVGTPGNRFPAAIDSGSFTLDIEGSDCSACVHTPPNRGYDPSNSSTSVNLNQPWSNTYETCVPTDPTQPCTVSGGLYTDTVSVGGSKPVKVQFGRINDQTSNFYQFAEVDGVCGYAGSMGQESVIGSLYHQGAIPELGWSLCLNEQGTKSNGTLTLGGFDSAYATGPAVYTPNASPGKFYSMFVEGMAADSQKLQGVENVVIIDSGTNDLLLNDEAYSSLFSVLKGMCSSTNLVGICGEPSGETLFDGKCFDMSASDIAKYPNIDFQLKDGLKLTMTGKDYILNGYGTYPFKTGKYCLGVGKTGYGGLFIVGDNLMQNYYVHFDIAQNRIGWAPVNATACGSLPLH